MGKIDWFIQKHGRQHLNAIRTVWMFYEGRETSTVLGITKFTLLVHREQVIENITKGNVLLQKLQKLNTPHLP